MRHGTWLPASGLKLVTNKPGATCKYEWQTSYLEESSVMGTRHGQVAAGRSHGPGWQGVVRIAANVAGLVWIVPHCKAVKGSLHDQVNGFPGPCAWQG